MKFTTIEVLTQGIWRCGGVAQHLDAYRLHHFLDFDARGAQLGGEVTRVDAVAADRAVLGDPAGRRGESDEGARRRHLGQAVGVARGSPARREGVVAAGVDDEDAGARTHPVDMREQRLLHVDGLVAHLGLVAQRDVDRQQVVAPADLHAVAGVVEDRRDLVVFHAAPEFPQHALEVAGIEIEVLAHFEVEAAQGLRDQASIVLGIVQRDFRVSPVADHECDAALPGGFDLGAAVERWQTPLHHTGTRPRQASRRRRLMRAGGAVEEWMLRTGVAREAVFHTV